MARISMSARTVSLSVMARATKPAAGLGTRRYASTTWVNHLRFDHLPAAEAARMPPTKIPEIYAVPMIVP